VERGHDGEEEGRSEMGQPKKWGDEELDRNLSRFFWLIRNFRVAGIYQLFDAPVTLTTDPG
jgi:hypothetical protein